MAPGYPSVYRAAARRKAESLGGTVRWDRRLAIADTAAQCRGLPAGVRRIIVPVGSGLVAAGILCGLAGTGRAGIKVVGISVSELVDAADIAALCAKAGAGALPAFELIKTDIAYETPADARLPDGARLDPYYAAKALPFCRPGDCLWVTGYRGDSAARLALL